jgi:hypothetical protein
MLGCQAAIISFIINFYKADRRSEGTMASEILRRDKALPQ